MRYQLLFFMILGTISCKTPTELLEEGNYNSAFKKAVNEIRAKKNVTENIKVIEAAAEIQVREAMLYTKVKRESPKVKDWIKTQSKVYTLLEDLGQANILTKGSITKPYDKLCTAKKEIDYQIVEYYYDEGQDHLDRYYTDGNKVDARNAYYSFKECEKHQGQEFFLNLQDYIEDALQKGTVYYVSNYGSLGNKLFLKYHPKDADFLPDCDIFIDHGYVDIQESESSSSKNYSKEIETGKETIVDTSGNVTYKPIYETIEATVTTKTITITARVTTFITSKNITGQCSEKSRQFTTETSDSYEEISVEGDEDAIDHNVQTKSGEPAFFESNLESEVLRMADRRIGI